MPVLSTTSGKEEVTRLILYGARMDVWSVKKMDQRIGAIHAYLSSRKCRPCFHGVTSVRLDGQSFSEHGYALGPM